jgi:hypothetical protein
MADRNTETLLRGPGKRLRPIQLLGIEIDMGVEVANFGLGHCVSLSG